MTYNILSTGSQGNAVVVGGSLLIDCGVPFKALEPVKKRLQLALLTHSHCDHFQPRTVGLLHRERPALRWGCCEWMVGPLLEAGVDRRRIDVYTAGSRKLYPGLCHLRAVNLSHNVPNCGYCLDVGGERLFYATDTGTLEGVRAPNYDLYLIEANHTRAELEARMEAKRAAGAFAYERAAAENHLSREQAEEWLARNAGPNSRYVFLHQHQGKGG